MHRSSWRNAIETAAKEVAAGLVAGGFSAEPPVFDLLDPFASAAAVQRVVESRGRLDVPVNNAGINCRGDSCP
jgi:NAD(P)-dependent dehydrogenase (short-subunit alcohol dehydrogenase family)